MKALALDDNIVRSLAGSFYVDPRTRYTADHLFAAAGNAGLLSLYSSVRNSLSAAWEQIGTIYPDNKYRPYEYDERDEPQSFRQHFMRTALLGIKLYHYIQQQVKAGNDIEASDRMFYQDFGLRPLVYTATSLCHHFGTDGIEVELTEPIVRGIVRYEGDSARTEEHVEQVMRFVERLARTEDESSQVLSDVMFNPVTKYTEALNIVDIMGLADQDDSDDAREQLELMSLKRAFVRETLPSLGRLTDIHYYGLQARLQGFVNISEDNALPMLKCILGIDPSCAVNIIEEPDDVQVQRRA